MDDFVKRVVRIKEKAEEPFDPGVEKATSPEALAAQHVEISGEVRTVRVGPPSGSTLYADCIRMRVIAALHKLSAKKYPLPTGQRLIFGMGDAFHKKAQNEPFLFGDRRCGWWECSACGAVLYFGFPPKRRCSKCGARAEAIRYKEHSLALTDPLVIFGHPDLFLTSIHNPAALPRVSELKTMEGEMFEKLKGPLIQHVWQVCTYVFGCKQDKSLPIKIDGSIGYIVYMSKRPRKKNFPVKMFEVNTRANVMRRVREKLKAYTVGVRKGELPEPLKVCVNKEFKNWEAKSCPAKRICMGAL